MTTNWRPLGNPSPTTLTDVRLQLHWAAQLIASVGYTCIPLLPDDSQSNMGWNEKRESLVGHPVPAQTPFTVGLCLEALAVEFAHVRDGVVADYPLDGKTLDQAYTWLGERIADTTNGELAQPLARPPYEIPPHSVGRGSAFSLDRAASAELARWYANANEVLRALIADQPNGSPVRCWPHHFDIGALIVLDPDEDPESARSIGLGMTPGDDNYAEPYYYVNPYPRPIDAKLPRLSDGGHWHTEGWTGAILPATALVEAQSAEAQASRVRGYLASAMDSCLRILDTSAL